MKITKLSTKGQIIIPEELRKNFEIGTAFAVTKKDNLIVLKKLDGLTTEEEKELKRIKQNLERYRRREGDHVH